LPRRAAVNRMPTPRSNPSMTTYMATASARSAYQTRGSQNAAPSYSMPNPNMPNASDFAEVM
jgi:hypothetical protein